MRRDILLKIMIVLSLIGLATAGYQTVEHYFLTDSICDFTAGFTCSVVTESQYGELPFNSGIALSGWGMLWWGALIVLLYGLLKDKYLIGDQEFYTFLMLVFGILFVIYLVAVEIYFLPLETGTIVICPLCTLQHILILALFPLTYKLLDKPIKDYIDTRFYFVAGTAFLIAAGGYLILAAGTEEIDYYNFTECLAEQDATMYGFHACPNCNKQEHLLGQDAFKQNIEGTGRYVLCRPEEEANKPIGERLEIITILPEYEDRVNRDTTQGELCSLMVGRGTPTWLIGEHQVSGWQTIPELAELSGCPIPEQYSGPRESGESGVTQIR